MITMEGDSTHDKKEKMHRNYDNLPSLCNTPQ